MPELMEAFTNIFKSFVDDEPKPPLHIIEVGNCWSYLAFLEEATGISQIAINTTTDVELSSALHEELHLIQTQAEILRKFMIDEGIPLPPNSQEKTKCDSEAIPAGAKETDYEIANSLAVKIVTATIATATASAESVRNDVALMFAQFLGQKLSFGATLKELMRKRNWLKVPPPYTPPGLPHNQ